MRTMTRFAVLVTTMALYWVVAAAHAVAADPTALQRTGTGKDVPALAPLLLREDLTMSARLALQAIPGPEAGEALRAAVEKTSGLIKVGIIDSLGVRREVAAVATLTQALSDADPLVVGAAGLALGKMARRSVPRPWPPWRTRFPPPRGRLFVTATCSAPTGWPPSAKRPRPRRFTNASPSRPRPVRCARRRSTGCCVRRATSRKSWSLRC
ncbi:MAG: hypothetical protein NTY19_36300 [Planctomycetota bacterium]|nr:hypothetical protein [Planctomycetota bacterium]